MCYGNVLSWAIGLTVLILFQSCSKDNELLQEPEIQQFDAVLGRGGESGNGGPEDQTPQEVDVSVLTDWTQLFLQLDQEATGMRPNATARAIAYIYLTAYEVAVPRFQQMVSTQNRFEELDLSRRNEFREINVQISLNTALAIALDHFLYGMPGTSRELIEALETSRRTLQNTEGSGPRTVDSEAWGTYVAQQVITFSQTDNQAEAQILDPQPRSYEPPTGEGYWTYSADPERALFPYWGRVRTFAISPEETTSVPPIPYSADEGSEYHAQMLEVREINDRARNEDNDDLWQAEFWSDDVEGLMISPPARQVSIALQLITQHDTPLPEALELMLRLGFSLNDAAVSTWADKYDYMVMRPNVYLQEYVDSDFQTNLYRLIYWPNPSFPGYPSGHSCFASAAAGLFIRQFGNSVNFTDETHSDATAFRGAPRSFSSLTDMAEENAYSRIPLGVHMRMDCTEGLRLGYEIAAAVGRMDLNRPRRGRGVVTN
ncbi:MAG: vanadium-dependent haloperoxidase [Saprospiraceae bacterium]|nr:vanadium-dependent haloperoxidase [Saprospiraceae bacterium]